MKHVKNVYSTYFLHPASLSFCTGTLSPDIQLVPLPEGSPLFLNKETFTDALNRKHSLSTYCLLGAGTDAAPGPVKGPAEPGQTPMSIRESLGPRFLFHPGLWQQ